jgi:cell division protein FtsI (penicillin-binding protein 3)/stage V sporulation protein D (sporulation-specific penicillin-binding protein)
MARYIAQPNNDVDRLRTMAVVWLVIGALFIVRLFYIQVVQHKKYTNQASGARTLNQTIKAKRGEIFGHDVRQGQQSLYPFALNRDQLLLISDNRKISDVDRTAMVVSAALSMSPEETEKLKQNLGKKSRAYQMLVKDVKPEIADTLVEALDKENITGLYFDREPARLYPERELLSHITGFVGRTEKGEPIGRYGVEAYFDERLRGQHGFVKTEKDPFGGWIPVADRDFEQAKDGDDLIVTIDRTIQLKLCQALSDGLQKYSARSGSGIIMDPKTGAILGMCNVPYFDPNEYQKVENPGVYNNSAIFTAYEPGSTFKLVTMVSALDAGKVRPHTTFVDAGNVVRDSFTIRNAANKVWGTQTMTGVIKESINTGTVFAADLVGKDLFQGYVKKFGFGMKSGVELKTEEVGNIKSLSKSGAVFLATASFGQGLTATSLQMIQAYAAIANEGVMMKPTIVHAWRSQDGETVYQKPEEVRRVVSKKSAAEMTEMLRVAVEDGHGRLARVPGYTVVGKTGTAQISGAGGKYTEDYNHAFIGFAPMNDPRFVMLIKFEAPSAKYSESTAVPTFGEVAKFLVEYLGITPDKPTEIK